MTAQKTVPEETPDTAQKKIAVVVLGMHRSGTSALGGVLTHLGCTGPETPIPPNEENPKGFFESRRIVRFDETILTLGQSAWHDWRILDPSHFPESRQAAIRAKAITLIDEEFGDAPMIVLKDPRICRLLPVWTRALQDTGRRPVFVHVLRDPLDVARSLHLRNGFDPTYGLLPWLRHMLEAEAQTRGQPRVFVNYADVLSDWRKSVARLERRLAIKFPVRPGKAAAGIEGFLDSGLNRSRRATGQTGSCPPLPNWVDTVQTILESWTTRAERKKDHTALDAVRNRLNEAQAMFIPLIDNALGMTEDLERARAEAEIEKKRAIDASRQAQKLTQDLDVANMRGGNLQHDIDRQQSKLHQSQEHLDEARARLKEQSARVAWLESVQATRDRDIGRLAAAQNTALQKIDGLSNNLARLEGEKAALLQSVSWRVTVPVRRAGVVLRRLGLWRNA